MTTRCGATGVGWANAAGTMSLGADWSSAACTVIAVVMPNIAVIDIPVTSTLAPWAGWRRRVRGFLVTVSLPRGHFR